MTPTEPAVRAMAQRLNRYQFTVLGPMLEWLADTVWPRKYGWRNIVKMYAEINVLRKAIRSEGSPAVQAAWDAVEEHIDYAYRHLERP
jgi:hypothetical protein